MPRLTEETYDRIIEDYLSGMSQLAVGKKNGIGRDAVGNILRRRGIEVREYTGERDSNKKWYWNTEYFSQRNPEVAYWAGFMMADGSLSDVGRSYSLVFFLQEKDRPHIELFCSHIGLPKEAIYLMKARGMSGDSYGVRLNYIGLPEQLLPWGIVPRKTYNFTEPKISIELLPHFLRGWADGDGHIYTKGRGARFTVSGSKISLNWYEKSLRSLGYDGYVGHSPRNNLYEVMYIGGQNQVSKVCELIQSDSELRLERKWNVEYQGKYETEIRLCRYCKKEILVPTCFREKRGFYCDKECFKKDKAKKLDGG